MSSLAVASSSLLVPAWGGLRAGVVALFLAALVGGSSNRSAVARPWVAHVAVSGSRLSRFGECVYV